MIIFYLFSLVTVLSDTPDSLILKYSAEYDKNIVGDKVQYYLKGGGTYPEESGLPELASVKRRILTPANGKVELKYKVLGTHTERGIPTIIKRYGESETRKVPKSYAPLPVIIRENRPSPHGNATIMINPFSFDGKAVKVRSDILIKIYFYGGRWISPRGYQRKNAYIFLNKVRGEKIRTSAIQKLRQEAFLYAKIKTTKEGLYEITPTDLQEAGIDPSQIDPEEIEILGGYDRVLRWEMDSLLAMDTLPGVLPAVYEVNENGSFEEGERILFYAHSLSGWGRNSFKENVFFYNHPYTDTNVYWLRFSGENPHTMEEISQSGGENVTHFTDTIHLEEDVRSPLQSGLAWGWKELSTTGAPAESSADTLNITFNALDNYNNQAIILIAFYPKTAGDYDIEVSLNGQSISKTIASVGQGNRTRTVFADTINALNSDLNNIVITLETPDESIIMDYVEVIYERRLVADENQLLVTQSETAIKNYTVEGFISDPYVLNISNSRNPSLVSHSFSNGNVNLSSDSRRTLLQYSPYAVDDISLDDPTSLLQGGADWIVITDNRFLAQASRLKNWRENHIRGITSPVARVIEIDDIYDNFSYGVRDPSAIKRFLYWTQENWNPPVSYVLLFGDGSYDEKNLTGNGKTSFIPIHTEGTTVHYSGESFISNPSCDNWFVDFNEDLQVVPDIPVGRVTVSGISEANGWIDKLMNYENSAEAWRMSAILLADDAFTPGMPFSSERAHTNNMEELSTYLPDWLYQDKIYLMEYPMVSGAKPAARQDYIESISEGALVGLYIGHGNLKQLAHEKALQIEDINLFSNGIKAPFYYFGACYVGYFERPDEDCIGGYSNLYKDGGNIVSIAGGRATSYSPNLSLGERIIGYLFGDSVNTPGDAFLFAMEGGGDETYTFFGDPATSILIDSVSLSVSMPDTAVGGIPSEIRGKVINSAEKIFALVTEARYDTILDATEGTDEFESVTIKKEGKTIFRGSAPVVNDSFALKVNIPYDIQSDSGRVNLYSRGEKESYSFSQIYFTEGSTPLDSTPPTVEFRMDNMVIESGDLIPFSGEITVVITDSSGLDLRSASNLRVIINNSEELFLTDRFSFTNGSSTKGEVSFTYREDWPSDSINFVVHARDNAGNEAVREISFRIAERKLLLDAKNYPNPMRERTVIVYDLSGEASVSIKIFTIAGRLVRELLPGLSDYGVNYAEWDGRDSKGRLVSNGIYYYAIKAGDSESYYGKIAVIR